MMVQDSVNYAPKISRVSTKRRYNFENKPGPFYNSKGQFPTKLPSFHIYKEIDFQSLY